MAGIGFELKKMFSQKGLLSIIKAYGYAGVVCVGPMLLGVALLLGIRLIAQYFGTSEAEIELLNSMVTYTLLVSLIVTSAFSMVTTRYTADQLYMEKESMVMPSFLGSVSVMLVVGCIGYGIFLLFSGIPLTYQVLCLMFFGEMIIVWTEINYLTAIKDYKGILLTFAVALAVSLAVGFGMVHTGMDIISVLLATVCLSYGIMSVWYYKLLIEYFPEGTCSSLYFLKWFNKYPQLFWLGLAVSFGMYGHILIMWTSPVKKQVYGLFYGAPAYDIPALIAFLSILITTINFVTSVEVNFYPKYRNYFSLFNDGGSYADIEQAETEMKSTLINELAYTFTKQFFATVVFIIAGTFLFSYLPLGITDDMLGIYRVLCVGYAFFAAGNCSMMIQLYFSDNKGALISAASFMAVSCIGTFLLRNYSIKYYGVGFLIGGIVFCVVSLILLRRYLNHVMYHVLSSQPIVAYEHKGILTKISNYFEKRYQKRYFTVQFEESGEDEN